MPRDDYEAFMKDLARNPNGTRWSEVGHPGYAVRGLKIKGHLGTAEPDGSWEVLRYADSGSWP